MDILFGLVIYFVLKLAFGQAFSYSGLLIVLFFAIAPDLDFIPFVILRRRLRLLSHWLIHFPALYLPLGLTVVWFVGRDWFYATAFLMASLAHFLHDSASVPGIEWFWPFSPKTYALKNFRFVFVTPEERYLFYEGKLRRGAEERSILDEIKMRLGPWRPDWFKR